MSWEFLLLLACPLMMLFCMKGMFGGDKNKDSKENSNSQLQTSQQDELQSVQLKMADLMEQNHQMMEEIKSLKASKSKDSNVVQLEKDQGKQEAL